ncbi:MAG TPA: ATP-dependent DNA ligase, partial [Myxococcaceae bacterium]
ALASRRLEARERKVEGLMLKRLDSPYRTGRRRGDWWKWKIDPFQVDAVLLYAHPGNGRRANLFTDYTFAVWDEGTLVPVAKAYSGLSDAEIRELDGWVRSHTLQRFGPVRAVEPSQVFELHFEGIARSTRHKSGVAVRFPRIARWRTDKPAAEADTLETLQRMIPAAAGPGDP